MANGNGLGAHYLVDGSVFSAAMNGHPNTVKLLQDFGSGRAHVCSHTWAAAKDSASIPNALLAAKPIPLAPTEQCWTLVNVLGLQIVPPAFAPYSVLEPKILIIASARLLNYQIVTEDNIGPISLATLCAAINIHCYGLNDV
jgi:hypothetical protein